jgi:hypothetical protein
VACVQFANVSRSLPAVLGVHGSCPAHGSISLTRASLKYLCEIFSHHMKRERYNC